VSRRAAEGELDLGGGERGMHEHVAIVGVIHHGGVDVFEHAGFEQAHLAAAAFLRRGADELDAARRGGAARGSREREEGAERAGRDQVVAAGVADLGQRVVLGEDRDLGMAAADARSKCRRQAAERALDRQALGLDRLAQPRGGAVLFEGELGRFVQPIREGHERGAEGIDGLVEVLAIEHGGD
jgi:hypothetical protein